VKRADLTLTAGPNPVSARVAAALGSPILYHYDPVFQEHFRDTERMVAEIYGTSSHEIILMQGEAILGLEAAARSLVREGTSCLNLVSGVFGKWFGFWLTAIGADLHEIEVPYDEAVTGAAVDVYLTAHPEITVVSMVHSETPSGTLNPVWDIGPIARRHGAVTIVDCVSSWAGIELKPEEWQLDLLIAGPQKCLGGPPGMSLVAVSDQAWAAIEANPDAPRGSFLSLLDWRDTWHGKGSFPYTPSVSDLNGVHAACQELLEEGLDASIARHQRVFDACWTGVVAMGLRPWAATKEIGSACATAIHVPDGLDDITVRDYVREHYNVQISSGQSAGNLVRIGHLGATARPILMVAGLAALGQGLVDLGATVDVGAGVAAAMASLSASGSQT
jgi:pyridoxamine--pyruvate transaminase